MITKIIMLGYLLVTFSIGIILTRTNKSVQEFFVAKRGLSIILIVPLLFAEMIGGAATVGVAAEAYKLGIASVWVNWSMTLGVILFVVFMLKFYRVLGVKASIMSVPEVYKFRFDNKTRFVMVIITSIVFSIFYALQPLSAASVLGPMFNVENVKALAWGISIFFIITTITGGLQGLAWMNVVHSIVMYLGLGIAALFAVKNVGGIGPMNMALPSNFYQMDLPDIWTVLATLIGTGVSYLAAPTCASVAFGAKSLKTSKNGIYLGGLLIIPFAVFVALIGMAAKVALPNVAAKNVLFTMAAHLSPFIAGFVSMAVIAAIFSTAPSMLLIVSTTITRDLYKGIFKTDATDVEQLVFSRISIGVIGLLCTYFGLNITSILGQLSGAFQIRSVAGIVLFVSLLWPRVNSTSAFWSMLVGGFLAAGWHFTGNPFGVSALWPSLVLGMVILVVLTLLQPEKESEGYLAYQRLLKEYNEEAYDYEGDNSSVKLYPVSGQ